MELFQDERQPQPLLRWQRHVGVHEQRHTVTSFFRCRVENLLFRYHGTGFVFSTRRIRRPQRTRTCGHHRPIKCTHSTKRSRTWQVSNHVRFTAPFGCLFQGDGGFLESIHVTFGRGGFPQRSSGRHRSSIYAHQHAFRVCASQDGKRAPCYFLEERCVEFAVSIQHERVACTTQERCGCSFSSRLAQLFVHFGTDETTRAQPRTRTFCTSLCIRQGRIRGVQSIQQQQEPTETTDEPCDLLIGDLVAQRETKHRHVGTVGMRTNARGRPLPSTRLLG